MSDKQTHENDVRDSDWLDDSKWAYAGYAMRKVTDKDAACCIALIAHDACKHALLDWARTHRGRLNQFTLCTTGTTGTLLHREIGLRVRRLLNGAYGGDAQIGALIAERQVQACIFFWDPLTAQPHEPDVKNLLRLAVLHNIPTACNRATADLLISSAHFNAPIKTELTNETVAAAATAAACDDPHEDISVMFN